MNRNGIAAPNSAMSPPRTQFGLLPGGTTSSSSLGNGSASDFTGSDFSSGFSCFGAPTSFSDPSASSSDSTFSSLDSSVSGSSSDFSASSFDSSLSSSLMLGGDGPTNFAPAFQTARNI